MSAALEVQGLRKQFRRVVALNELTFSVPKGVTCAFVGANGAGKTTTFSVIGGFLRANAGAIRIAGELQPALSPASGTVGVLPQDMRFFEERTLESQLGLFARLTGFSGIGAHDEVTRVLSAVGLLEKRAVRAKELSRGMRVRLGVAQALIGSPPLLLLDEPMAGLDPVVRVQLKEFLQGLDKETTVMVSSHELGELQSFCDYIVAIDKGRCLFAGPMEEALGAGDQFITYRLGEAPSDVAELERKVAPMRVRVEDGKKVLVQFGEESPEKVNAIVLPWLLEQKLSIVEVTHNKSLEDAYLKFVKG